MAKSIKGQLPARSLTTAIWDLSHDMSEIGFHSSVDIETYLQSIVHIFSRGPVYDSESNVVNLSSKVLVRADAISKKHRKGELHSRSREAFDDKLRRELKSMDCS